MNSYPLPFLTFFCYFTFICLSAYLPVCLLHAFLHVCLSACLPGCRSSVCLSLFCLAVYIYARLPISLSASRLSTCQPISCLPVSISVYLPIFLSACLPIRDSGHSKWRRMSQSWHSSSLTATQRFHFPQILHTIFPLLYLSYLSSFCSLILCKLKKDSYFIPKMLC